MTPSKARAITLALLADRAQHATICPSEVARAMTSDADAANGGRNGGTWREAMPIVHETIDRLEAEGLVRRTWKGKPLARRGGPYRVHRITE